MGYEDELDKAHQYAERVRQKQKLKEIRHSNDKKRDLSFSKVFSILMCINLFIVEFYSMVVMVVFHDLSSLGGLIAAVIGQCVTLVAYMHKAKSENCEGGITYETTMYGLKENVELSVDETLDDGAVG